ncbi:MAG: hypothetical protein P8K76_07360 [Candidatus Binatia bacterium]|nr:hypothetical protein [Candidatus Binatia bacterium]MDG1960538.1 hypothetical protein [Candidatus Binatia bacterium]MDG2009581.1 hypothetical protein [Candidatus Binatia bacterium]HAC81228.1 hypothetical protein [Deltaproteobacteria bacterium]
MSDVLTHALDQASDELGLQSYYRDLVRPIIKLPRKQWPECCGGNCEPCAQVLVAVAQRVQELLADQA